METSGIRRALFRVAKKKQGRLSWPRAQEVASFACVVFVTYYKVTILSGSLVEAASVGGLFVCIAILIRQDFLIDFELLN